VEIRRLASTDELFAVADGDYLVRTDVAPDALGIVWAAEEGAFAFCGPTGADQETWLTVLGKSTEGAAVLLRHALGELPHPPLGISVPRGTDTGFLDLTRHDTWDYMVFDDASGPPAVQPGEERVVPMLPGPETDAEITEFLTLANPSHHAKPGWDAIRYWGSIRDDDDGVLLAAGAYCVRDGGNGYLASIGTVPAARGQGLGAALAAWLTRQSIKAGNPFCSLGHFSPNEPARRIYLRLGYRTTHEMSSGEFAPRAGAAA
jgi:ribosomal protein S18 acetylase RimI-like enzyme